MSVSPSLLRLTIGTVATEALLFLLVLVLPCKIRHPVPGGHVARGVPACRSEAGKPGSECWEKTLTADAWLHLV